VAALKENGGGIGNNGENEISGKSSSKRRKRK
jgi:hypothetical protein